MYRFKMLFKIIFKWVIRGKTDVIVFQSSLVEKFLKNFININKGD